MLVDCQQNVYVGEISDNANPLEDISLDEKRKVSTYQDVSALNLPYSKLIAVDRIKLVFLLFGSISLRFGRCWHFHKDINQIIES